MRRKKPCPFYRTKEFKSLEAEWAMRLKASGFNDIESHQGTTLQDLYQRINFRPNVKEVNERYFDWAMEKLSSAAFKTPRHRFIWEHHAKGKSAASIGRTLKLSRWRISDILTEINSYLKALEKPTRTR